MRLAILTFALAVMLASCGKEPPKVDPRPTPTPTLEGAGATPERTMLDMTGRTVAVPARVERVVALSPSAVDFVLALGLSLVGRPSDATNPGAAGAAAIGSTISPDFKAIAALSPDLVVADAAFHGARQRDFDQFPYPVFVLKVATYADVLAALAALGEVTGHKDQAALASAGIEQRVSAALARVAGATPPTVLVLTGSGRDIYAGSDATYVGGLLKQLGAVNVMGAAPQGAPIAGFGLVELAQAVATNPDVVLAISSGGGGLANQLRTTPAWANSAAVTGNRVFELDPGRFLRSPGPQVADAIEELARLLYPGR